MISIDKMAFSLPAVIASCENDYAKIGISPQHGRILARIYQVKNIPIATFETLFMLCQKAIDKMIAEENKSKIKYIIHLHSAPVNDLFGSSIIRLLKYYYQLDDAIYFSTSFNKCASLFKVLSLSSTLLTGHLTDEKMMLISGDIAFTAELRIINSGSITGDAAAVAMIALARNSHQLLQIQYEVDGRFAHGIWLDHLAQTQLNGVTTATMENLIQKILQQANLTIEQIKCIIPHNLHLDLWLVLAKKMAIPKQKIYTALFSQTSHCFCSDFILNFFQAKAEGIIQAGDYVIATAIGVGSIFSVMLLQV